MSSVFQRDGATTVPPSLDVTAARLAQFFTDKVDGVHAATENAPPPYFSLYSATQLSSFEDVTDEEDSSEIYAGFSNENMCSGSATNSRSA